MKRTLALATIVALSLSLGSCRKKNNEPIAPKPNPEKPAPTPGTNPNTGTTPTPTPTPNPIPDTPAPDNKDNNNQIKPDESPINTAVSIKIAKGQQVTIKSDKPLTITGAKLVDATKHTYEVTNASGFGIDGAPETLVLGGTGITEFALDKEMPLLKSLKVVTNESLKKLSLQGAKNLEQLNIVGAQAGEQVLDLSKHSKLRLLALGNKPSMIGKFTASITQEYAYVNKYNSSTDTRFKSVSLPASLEVLLLARAYTSLTGADNLPNLRAAYLYTIEAPLLGDLAFAGSPNLERLMLAYISGSAPLKSVIVKNKPHLKDLLIYKMSISHLLLEGLTSNTQTYAVEVYNIPEVEIHNSAYAKIVDLLLLTEGSLKSADLTNNSELTSDKLIELAQKLSKTKGGNLKIEEAKATDAVKEAFQKIGWTVNK